MPELRKDLAPRLMNLINHTLPSRKGLLAVEMRHIGIGACRRMRNVGSLGHNQAHASLGAAALYLLTRRWIGERTFSARSRWLSMPRKARP